MDNLNKFTVASLFGKTDGTKAYFGGHLDVNTLFKNKENTNNFNSRTLLNNVYDRRKMLLRWYNNMYTVCCEKITIVNSNGLTDMIFEVMNYIPECPEYKSIECLKFIEKNLITQLIDTKIISDTKIFITWNNLESKIDGKNK